MNERNERQDKNEGSSYSESENPAEYSEDETKIDSFSLKLSSNQCYKLRSTTAFQLFGFCFLSGQKQPLEVFYKKKVFLKILQNSQEDTWARVSFFNKVVGLRPAALLKTDSGTGVFL